METEPGHRKARAKRAADAPRAFRLRDEADVARISVGADPRVSIGAGDTFETADHRLADRLAAHPELCEVNR